MKEDSFQPFLEAYARASTLEVGEEERYRKLWAFRDCAHILLAGASWEGIKSVLSHLQESDEKALFLRELACALAEEQQLPMLNAGNGLKRSLVLLKSQQSRRRHWKSYRQP